MNARIYPPTVMFSGGSLAGWSTRNSAVLTGTAGTSFTSYQVNVQLNSANFDFSIPKADGSDLRVTAGNGTTLLPFWLEWYDPAGMTASLWVLVNTIPDGGFSTCYIYSGNASASSVSSFNSTFQLLSPGTGTLALFHASDGSGTTLSDAMNTYPGTIAGGSWASGYGGGWGNYGLTNGFTGGSTLTLSGTSSSVLIPSLLDVPPFHGTIRLWVNVATVTANACIFSKIDANNCGILLYLAGSGAGFTAQIRSTDTPSTTTVSGHIVVNAGQWYQVLVSWGDVLRLQVNGRIDADGGGMANALGNNGQGGVWTTAGTPYPFTLGALNTTGTLSNYFNGSIAEVEVLSRQIIPEETRRAMYRSAYVPGVEELGRWMTASHVNTLEPSNSLVLWDGKIVQECSVLQMPDGSWTLYYDGVDSGSVSAGYATGSDGLTWTRHGTTALITNGTQACVMKGLDGIYRWYLSDNYIGASNIHMATSTDGLTWTSTLVANLPIVVASGLGGILPATLSNSAVWQEGPTEWHMLVEASISPFGTNNTYNIFHLTSTDGATWTPDATGALRGLLLWANGSADGPSIPIKDSSGVYHLYYHCSVQGFGPSSVGHATSTDLVSWTVQGHGDAVAILDSEVTAVGVADQFADPWVMDLGSEVRLYGEIESNTNTSGTGAYLQAWRYMGTSKKLWTDVPSIQISGPVSSAIWTPASLSSPLQVWMQPENATIDTGMHQLATGRNETIAVVPGSLGTANLTVSAHNANGFASYKDYQGRWFLIGSQAIRTAMAWGNLSSLFPSAATWGTAFYLPPGLASTTFELWSSDVLSPNGLYYYASNGDGYFAMMRSARLSPGPTAMPYSGYHVLVIESSASAYTVYLDGSVKGSFSGAYSAGSFYCLGAALNDSNHDVASWWPGYISEVVAYSAINSTDRGNLTTYLGRLVGLTL
jgi:Domain of unknown function (DUF2341)